MPSGKSNPLKSSCARLTNRALNLLANLEDMFCIPGAASGTKRINASISLGASILKSFISVCGICLVSAALSIALPRDGTPNKSKIDLNNARFLLSSNVSVIFSWLFAAKTERRNGKFKPGIKIVPDSNDVDAMTGDNVANAFHVAVAVCRDNESAARTASSTTKSCK